MATKSNGKATKATKGEKAGKVEKTETKARTRNTPLAEAKEIFLGLISKHGRLDRTTAKELMAPLGFGPTANWTKMCRELEEAGLVRVEKSPEHEDKLTHYVLSSGKGKSKGKGKAKVAAATANGKAPTAKARKGDGLNSMRAALNC
jgi:hypothetical protein